MKERDTGRDLSGFRLARARAAFTAGDLVSAQEWLDGVKHGQRPLDLVAALEYEQAKVSMGQLRWGEAEQHLVNAAAAEKDSLHQQRLGLLRGRKSFMPDSAWSKMSKIVDAATRLSEGELAPQVKGVWACGAYFSRGSRSGAAWSKLLRRAKSGTGDDHEETVSAVTGYFCRWLAERTPLLRYVDVVIPVPPNPARYGQRMMSLPDELARAAQQQLALPMTFGAMRYAAGDDLELRGLSRAERHEAVAGSMAVGKSSLIAGRNALIVDDVITSGATLTEAARVLRAGGAADVYAACLSHTEG